MVCSRRCERSTPVCGQFVDIRETPLGAISFKLVYSEAKVQPQEGRSGTGLETKQESLRLGAVKPDCCKKLGAEQ